MFQCVALAGGLHRDVKAFTAGCNELYWHVKGGAVWSKGRHE